MLYEQLSSVELFGPLRKDKRDIVFREKTPANALYQVQTGLVKQFKTTAEGIEQISHFYLPGDIFGFEVLLGKTHQSTAMAIHTSDLLAFPIKLSSLAPKDLQWLARLLAEQTLEDQRHIAMLNKTRAMAKVAHFMLDMTARLRPYSHERSALGLNFPRNDMANYLSLSVETVCRELKKLEKAELIAIEKTRIHLTNEAQLKAIALS